MSAVARVVAPQLTRSKMSPRIVKADYAVRGKIVQRALELQKQLETEKLPFSNITFCNIGNPHNLGQKPLSFPREVLALCNNPDWLSHPNFSPLFKDDVKERAQSYVDALGVTGTGGYSQSPGVDIVRQEVANYIKDRDGHDASNFFPTSKIVTSPHIHNPPMTHSQMTHSQPTNDTQLRKRKIGLEDIFLTDGASQAVQTSMKLLLSNENDGMMIPIPQYPLYSAGICLNGGTQVNYYLEEDQEWAMNVTHLEEVLKQAESEGTNVKAIAIINPGNPTGQCLSYDNIRDIIDFCVEHNLVILADEVYQCNIWQPDRLPFHSFKKVLRDYEAEENKTCELISFHSVSKGFLGECGRRGGYMELTNITDDAREELYKLCSVNLCSNVEGQLMVGMMVNPPSQGQPSFEQYQSEKNGILDSLQRRAKVLVDAFNELEGITCEHTHGALYVFPRIRFPQKFVDLCESSDQHPDAVYCMELLERTGIVTVPGSGFGQKENEYHLRSTILPSEEEIVEVTKLFGDFHKEFVEKYR